MEAFREALDFCEMRDIGFSGLPWTYDNKQFGRRNVRVRLDRVVATEAWSNLFEHASVEHLVSDHCPVLLRLGAVEHSRGGPKILRYEIMWEREESLGEVVLSAWTNSSAKTDLGSIAKSLKEVMGSLQEWSKEKFGSVRRKLKELRDQLAFLHGCDDDTSRQQAKNKADEMNELLCREEMMWLQRSRISWLKEGDRNTKYFHQKAIWRSRKNRIRRLKASNGQWCDDPVQMAAMAQDFFKSLYSRDDNVNPEALVSLLQQGVSSEMNEMLCMEFSDEEIGNALFQIGPLKAPGPDGFPARFFQRNWGMMKEDIGRAVKEFFAKGVIPKFPILLC